MTKDFDIEYNNKNKRLIKEKEETDKGHVRPSLSKCEFKRGGKYHATFWQPDTSPLHHTTTDSSWPADDALNREKLIETISQQLLGCLDLDPAKGKGESNAHENRRLRSRNRFQL